MMVAVLGEGILGKFMSPKGLVQTQLVVVECEAEYEVPSVVPTLRIVDRLSPALA